MLYSKIAHPTPNGHGFDSQEIQTIDDICGLYNEHGGGQKIHELSRKEKAYLETNENHFISYKYAHDLLI